MELIFYSLSSLLQKIHLLQDDSSNDHVETNTELILNEELNLPLQVNEPENIEEQDPEIELEDSESPTSKTKAKLTKIINDLTEEKYNTPLRADPLLTYTWKDQVNEIIQRLNRETRETRKKNKFGLLKHVIIQENFKKNFKIIL